MNEKKLTDEAVNATAKSLKWVCNQIPNDLGNSNEEKMLKCIQLYCQQGIAVIERLQSENKELKSPKFASWKLKFFNLKEEFDKELSEHEEFTKKAKAEIERLTSLYDGQSAYMTSSIGDLPLTVEGLRKSVDEIARLLIVQGELQELNAKYYNEAKDLRRAKAELQKQVDELKERAKIDIKNEKNWGKIQTKQAVKDTAKEILGEVSKHFGGKWLVELYKKYGLEWSVEVE